MSPGERPDPPASILIVDDAPANLLALEDVLASPDYRIVRASSGTEALRLVLQQDFAVILLDVFMPQMDGFEVARILKQRERSRHTPIIFVTAADRDATRTRRAYEVGAIDYLHKPLEPALVRAKVAGLVALYRRTEEIRREADARRSQDRAEQDSRLARLDEVRERRYRNLAETIPPMVWTSHPDGAVDYCNRRWFDFTGLSFEHAQGWGWLAAVHPADVERFRARWHDAIQEKLPFEIECRVRNASTGTYRWQLARALPEQDDAGRILAWLGTFTDVDDLRQAQARERAARAEAEQAYAQAEEARQRAIFLGEATVFLAGSLDVPTTLHRVAHLVIPRLGDWCVVDVVSDDEQVGQMAAAHVDPTKEDLARSIGGRHPIDRGALHGVDRVVTTGRSEIYPELGDVEWAAEALGAEHPDALRALNARSYMIVPLVARERVVGAITFVYAESGRRYTADDLSFAEDLARRAAMALDNARLYAEAHDAVTARDEFLSIASHELKTPLTSLTLLLHLIDRRLKAAADEGVAPDLSLQTARAQAGAMRLARLVDELLDFSRVASRRVRLERRPVDLGAVVREVAENLRPALEKSGSTLDLAAVGEVDGCWDRLRIEQVTANLLANAIKYGQGRPIHVSVEEEGGAGVLRVRDEGIGISPESRERIFDAFERAVTERTFAGVGLGLYITRALVRAHGGEIEVESEPGQGSTFIVRLPRAVPSAEAESGRLECRGQDVVTEPGR